MIWKFCITRNDFEYSKPKSFQCLKDSLPCKFLIKMLEKSCFRKRNFLQNTIAEKCETCLEGRRRRRKKFDCNFLEKRNLIIYKRYLMTFEQIWPQTFFLKEKNINFNYFIALALSLKKFWYRILFHFVYLDPGISL